MVTLRRNLPAVAEQPREARADQQHRRRLGIRAGVGGRHRRQDETRRRDCPVPFPACVRFPQRDVMCVARYAEAFGANRVAETRAVVREHLRDPWFANTRCSPARRADRTSHVVVPGPLMAAAAVSDADSGECSLIDACPSELIAATLNRADLPPSRLGPSPLRSTRLARERTEGIGVGERWGQDYGTADNCGSPKCSHQHLRLRSPATEAKVNHGTKRRTMLARASRVAPDNIIQTGSVPWNDNAAAVAAGETG